MKICLFPGQPCIISDNYNYTGGILRQVTHVLPLPLLKARSIVAMGWASLAARVKELEETETVAKIKEGTVTIVDRSMDGLSKVSHGMG